MRCFSFFRRSKTHIQWKGILDDAYKEMEKAKSVLEKELSVVEALTAQYYAEGDWIRASVTVKTVVFLRRRIDFLNMGMPYAQLLLSQIRIIHDRIDCPEGLEEAMTGLLFAGDRCEEIPSLRKFKSAVQQRFGVHAIFSENHSSLNAAVGACLTVPVLSVENINHLIHDIAIHYNVIHPLPPYLQVPLVYLRASLYR